MSNEGKGGEKEKNSVQAEQVQHIKVPVLMDTAVPGRFAILNAQFNLNRITQNKTKLYHALVCTVPAVMAVF